MEKDHAANDGNGIIGEEKTLDTYLTDCNDRGLSPVVNDHGSMIGDGRTAMTSKDACEDDFRSRLPIDRGWAWVVLLGKLDWFKWKKAGRKPLFECVV